MREAGATTAEYAVGTVGAVSLAALLIRIGIDPVFAELVWGIVRQALDPGLLLEHLFR